MALHESVTSVEAKEDELILCRPKALHKLFVFRLAKTNVYPAVAILPRSDPANPVIFSSTKYFCKWLLRLRSGFCHPGETGWLRTMLFKIK